MSTHEIIFLWSHPRSLSSALERAMLERGDLRCFHEPFLYFYYVGEGRRELPHFEADAAHPTGYADIRAMILDAARDGPVFVKDMCYYVAERLAGDAALLRRARNTFVVRDPARSIPSYYRLDPQVTLEEIGLEAQFRVFEQVRGLTGAPPIVIDAEDLQRDPAGTVRAYCDALSIPFIEEALHWDRPLPEDWRFVAGWHAALAGSTGLGKGTTSAAGRGLDAAPHLREWCAKARPYYDAMRACRLTTTGTG